MGRKTRRYKMIDHTADVALEVYGNTLIELFINAALGLYEIMFRQPPETLAGNETVTFTVQGMSKEELLVSFLGELIYNVTVRHLFLYPFEKIDIAQSGREFILKCTAKSGVLNETILSTIQEVKSVTYHQLKIIKEKSRYRVKIVLDI